jgi:hypothetical protein
VTDAVDEYGYASDSHGEEVLRCVPAARPALSDVAALLDQARDRLQDWANTPVGQTLEGTAFVVTRRAQERASLRRCVQGLVSGISVRGPRHLMHARASHPRVASADAAHW